MPLSRADIASIQADAECLYDAAAVARTLDRMAADICAVMADSLPGYRGRIIQTLRIGLDTCDLSP